MKTRKLLLLGIRFDVFIQVKNFVGNNRQNFQVRKVFINEIFVWSIFRTSDRTISQRDENFDQ